MYRINYNLSKPSKSSHLVEKIEKYTRLLELKAEDETEPKRGVSGSVKGRAG